MKVKMVKLRNVRSVSTSSQTVSSLGAVIYSVANALVSLVLFIVTSTAAQDFSHKKRVFSIAPLRITRRT